MADRETIAATLAAGLLQPLAVPEDIDDFDVRNDFMSALDAAADHAISLYRLVLGKLPPEGGDETP
jgi:hypothetical protein